MKNIIFQSLIMAVISLVNANVAYASDPPTFDKTVHEFGIVKLGVPQQAAFTITNSSDQPMVITNVKASCGCTVTSYTKDAIQPGASSEITATYNAKKAGAFKKNISVYTNLSEEVTTLTLQGEVKAMDL